MLNITDLESLKITKVKPWAIYFTYGCDKYLLHGSDDGYESIVQLFRRVPLNDCGKYELECIHGRFWHSAYFSYEFIKYFGKNMCYSKINKEFLAYKLKLYTFIDSEINFKEF